MDFDDLMFQFAYVQREKRLITLRRRTGYLRNLGLDN